LSGLAKGLASPAIQSGCADTFFTLRLNQATATEMVRNIQGGMPGPGARRASFDRRATPGNRASGKTQVITSKDQTNASDVSRLLTTPNYRQGWYRFGGMNFSSGCRGVDSTATLLASSWMNGLINTLHGVGDFFNGSQTADRHQHGLPLESQGARSSFIHRSWLF